MVYGYIRVSTDRQTVKNQRFEIDKFCKKGKIKVGRWIDETISGTNLFLYKTVELNQHLLTKGQIAK